MRLIRAFGLAFAMYSKIPMPRQEWNDRDLEYVFCWFPAIGLVCGGLYLLWWRLAAFLGLSAALTAVVCVILPLAVTGAIHLDGFCDTADALASHQSRERKLEILKDSAVGAFALIGCVCYLLLEFALWYQAAVDALEPWVPAVVPVLSRSLSGLAAVTRKNARGSGLLATFTKAVTCRQVRWVLVGWLVVCAGGMLFLSLPLGGAALAAAGLTYGYYYVVSRKEFGGITGDLAGWFLQLCELACLLAVVIVGRVMAL